jgi:hypothetical protein
LAAGPPGGRAGGRVLRLCRGQPRGR